MGSDLFGAPVQHGIRHGGLPSDQKSSDAALVHADPRHLLTAMRPGRALLRSGTALGAHPIAGVVRQSAGLEGEQLFSAGARSAQSWRKATARNRNTLRVGEAGAERRRPPGD